MTELTTGERDAILVAKARAGTITGEELRQVSHFSIRRIDHYDIQHLPHADHLFLSDQKTEAKGRFMDYDDFVGEADDERAA